MDGLSIYQIKRYETMFLTLPCTTYATFNCPAVGKTTLLNVRSHNKATIITELQLNYQYLLL